MARQAHALRPSPGSDGRMPDPRTRPGMPDLYAYAHLLAEDKRRRPGDDVMSILLAQVDDGGGQVSVAEFENMFWLFAVAGNETLRNGLPGACIALLEHPGAQDDLRADPALMPTAVEEMLPTCDRTSSAASNSCPSAGPPEPGPCAAGGPAVHLCRGPRWHRRLARVLAMHVDDLAQDGRGEQVFFGAYDRSAPMSTSLMPGLASPQPKA
jgi:hypothetical protein